MRVLLALSSSAWLHPITALAVALDQIPLIQVPSSTQLTDYGNDNIPIANEAFERYIRDRMDRWHVPGLAIALLEGNKTWTRVS